MAENHIDSYIMGKGEPIASLFFALKDIILKFDSQITCQFKYNMPFFCFRGKMFCYIWVNKKNNEIPYIGFVEGKHLNHLLLLQEKRARMKILPIDPSFDIPIKLIQELLGNAIKLYVDGVVKIK